MSTEHDSTALVSPPVSASQLLDGMRLKLAAQVAPRAWRSPLGRLIDRLQAGVPLEAAVRQTSLPTELQSLFREALQLREPTGFVLDVLRARSQLQHSIGNLTLSLVYPLLLLALSVVGGFALSYELQEVIAMDELDAATVQPALDQHQALWASVLVMGWTGTMLLLLRWVGPKWAWTSVVGSFALVGRPLRWIKLQEILWRFKFLVDQGVPDAQVAQAAARSFEASSQAFATLYVARQVRAGMPIGAALSATMLSDSLCQPSLMLLDHSDGRFSEACEKCANLLGQMIHQRCRLLTTLVPIFLLVLVGSIIWSVLSTYLYVLWRLLWHYIILY
jgi:type II secretory pathway component PulF